MCVKEAKKWENEENVTSFSQKAFRNFYFYDKKKVYFSSNSNFVF